jgi:hypothetical protein
MATRHPARQAAQRRSRRATKIPHKTLYRRTLRCELLEDRRPLALVTVNIPSDSVDLTDGFTSLREAIFATNLVSGGDEIAFDFGHDGPETIVLTQGELRITDDLTINGPGAELLTIDASGNDPTPALDNGDGSRAINIDDGNSSTFIDVSLSALTLTGGDVGGDGGAILTREKTAISKVRITNNIAMAGGGIAALSASLSLSQSHLSENLARTSTSSGGTVGGGGGVFALSAELTIVDATLTGNRAANYGGAVRSSYSDTTVRDSVVTANYAGLYGGGIYTLGGAIDVIRCKVSDNFLHSSSGRGGAGLRVTNGTMNVIDSVVSFNRGGSGISASSSQLSIKSTSITDNVPRTAGGRGGGFTAYNSIVDISDSSIARNHDSYGGGISTLYGTLNIERTSIHDNIATELGGAMFLTDGAFTMTDCAVFNNSARVGGGLTLGGNFEITSSTISNNTASSGNGAGIEFYPGQGIIRFSTIADSRGSGLYFEWAPTVALDHVIVAGNGPDGKEDLQAFRSDRVTTRSSLIGYTSTTGPAEAPLGSPDINGNLIGGPMHGLIDPRLGPLVNNGGPTLTHALLPGSPAINAGDLNLKAGIDGVPQFDQRGEPFSRVVNGRIDIGAFEYQSPSDVNLLVDTLADESDGNHGRGDLSLREAIELSNLYPSDDTIRFDPALTTTEPATILLTMGELRISDDVTIEGHGAEFLTIDSSGNDPTPDIDDGRGVRIFNIDDGSRNTRINVSISGLTLTGGDASTAGGAIRSQENVTVLESVISGNASGPNFGQGGAIYSNDGNLTLIDCEVLNNTSRTGAGVYIRGGSATVTGSMIEANVNSGRGPFRIAGSGIHSVASILTVANSTISGNTGQDSAGVYATGSSRIEIVDSEFADNFYGIAIYSSGGATEITGSDFIGNEWHGVFLRIFDHAKVSISHTSVLDNLSHGIYAEQNAGTLEISDSVVSGHRASGIFAESSQSGVVEILNSTISGNTTSFSGGGISLIGGTATITHSSIYDNVSRFTGSYGGGGIHSNLANVTISDSSVHNNVSFATAGGIAVRGNLALIRSNVTGNTARISGGGIWSSGYALIDRTTIADNSADYGGGIRSGRTTILGSNIVGNSAHGLEGLRPNSGDGGGIMGTGLIAIVNSVIDGNTAVRRGGGIRAFSTGTTISNSTVSNNVAEEGGGVSGTAVISQSTVSNNAADIGGGLHTNYARIAHTTISLNRANIFGAGIFVASNSLTLHHSIIAANVGTFGDVVGLLGVSINARYSIIGHASGSGLSEAPVGSPDANGNLIGGPMHGAINPLLGPLADNGGPTPTHALLPGSPAIDAGDSAAMAGVGGVPEFDQRGTPFTRVYGGRIDIGAFESQPDPMPGDYNLNGVVDTADYVVWRKSLGSTTDQRADGNGDGIVNDADWQVWRGNFGLTAESTEQGAESMEPKAAQAPPQRPAWQPPVNDPPWRTSPGVLASALRPTFRPPIQRLEPKDDLLAPYASTRTISFGRNDYSHARRQATEEAIADAHDFDASVLDHAFETIRTFHAL